MAQEHDGSLHEADYTYDDRSQLGKVETEATFHQDKLLGSNQRLTHG
jgi:hypothetical protein